MALKFGDRIKETTSTSGVSDISLGGAVATFAAFSTILSNGDSTYYTLVDGSNWEIGYGVYASSGNTLSRTNANVLQSTNSDNRISLTGDGAEIFITLPADKVIALNNSNEMVIDGVTYLNATANRYSYLVSGSTQSVFNGADTAGNTLTFSGDRVDVYLNGIKLSKQQSDYTLSGGTTVTISPACSQNDIVEMVSFQVYTDSELVDQSLALSIALG